MERIGRVVSKSREEKEEQEDEIGDDFVTLEILSRLPVKSLMRFMCVWKRWKSVIRKDQLFIDLHLTRSKAARTFSLLHVFQQHTNRWIRLLSAEILLPSKEEEHGDGRVQLIRKTSLWNVWKAPFLHQHVICTLDGLICFMNTENKCARIYNSSTREKTPWIKSPVDEHVRYLRYMTLMTSVFGYDHTTKEYKVLALWSLCQIESRPSNNVVYEVLTVRRNSWRRIDGIPSISSLDTVSSVYVNGFIYLLCTHTDPYIQTLVEFNVGSEKFSMVETAGYIRLRDMPKAYLMELDGRLCYLTYDTQDETHRSLKMRILYNHAENVPDRKSMRISSTAMSSGNATDGSNHHWVEAETLALPSYTKLNSIRHIPGTNLFIIRSINDAQQFSYYIWNNRSRKIIGDISSLLRDETDKSYHLGFDTFTPNLLHVN